ncbi:MAG: pyridoxal phosphate-dependent aminotransferase [Candidatus Pacebacteria bacterium]|nr:pyridoxal phosphate-dependent aminotransferase [Candidatus Paceibacterota bacterium]
MIELLTLNQVTAENQAGVDLDWLLTQFSQETYQSTLEAMKTMLTSPKFSDYFDQICQAINRSPWVDSGFGTYFATVIQAKTVYGPRLLPYLNQAFKTNWSQPAELGSGVGCLTPWSGATKLLKDGLDQPDLMINYDSPGGREASRWAGAVLLNTKIGPRLDSPDYLPQDVYLTPSSTYAIDLFYETLARQTSQESPSQNRVVLLGPSYYVLALSAQDKGLPISRLISEKDQNRTCQFFPTPSELIRKLPQDTKALVITLPNNPNGETYPDEDFRQIIKLAKQRGIIICLDLLFDQLWLNQDNSPNPLRIAAEEGALDQIVIIDGFSKSANLAGPRIGLLATKNRPLERLINYASISRLSNPPLTIEPYLQFEALARSVQTQTDYGFLKTGNAQALGQTKAALESLTGSPWLSSYQADQLANFYQDRQNWRQQSQQYYQDNLALIEIVLEELNQRQSWRSPDQAAFNTLAGWQSPSPNNGLDKILKLFLTTGVVAMSSQCFGLKNPSNKFWTRITYGGLSRQRLAQALLRLTIFLDLWEELDLGNSLKYPVYDRQIPII